MHQSRPLTIGIVAGELSGDTLGEGFMKAIKQRVPDAHFVGIGGPKMKALGCQSLFDMEELAVMGLVEVLGRLPKLLRIKSDLVKYFTDNRPDVFIGIDAPDFNLRLEKNLKDSGIQTVHYVSPSVWAWRQKRIFKIKAATNLVLAFLPFEKMFYDKFDVPCKFVGHTLADAIPFDNPKDHARDKLGLRRDKLWLAVLPGSRGAELKMLARPFIETCQKLHAKYPDLGFVVALVNPKRKEQFKQVWQSIAPEIEFTLIDDTARNVIQASDVVMLASGTVALECMLINRPMVVAYNVNPITAFIAKRLVNTKFVSLPNILAGREMVKEFILEECHSVNLFNEVDRLFSNDNKEMMDQFSEMHHWIRKGADEQAANAVLHLIGKKNA